jgi:hypothetical protein
MMPLLMDLYNAASGAETDFRAICDAAETVLTAIEEF